MSRAVATAVCVVAMLITACDTARAQEASPEAFRVEFGTMFWLAQPDLQLQTGELGAANVGAIDFTREFNLTRQRFSDMRFVARPGRNHRLRFSYVRMQYEGATTLTPGQVRRFGDANLSGKASASVKWNLMRAGYQWNFLSREKFHLGALLEVKLNDIDAAASAGVAGAAQAVKAPIPTIGLAGRAYVTPRLAMSAEFSGMKIPEQESFGGSFYDFDVSAMFIPFKRFGIQAGFRSITSDFLVDFDRGHLGARGPYLGLVSRF